MPFTTQYGWHIVKLIKTYPVKSFKEMKNELTEKVELAVEQECLIYMC